MEFHNRRLLKGCDPSKRPPRPCPCPLSPPEDCFERSPPPPAAGKKNQFVMASVFVMAFIAAVALLFAIFCFAVKIYYLRRNNSRRRNQFTIFDDFVDENQGPVVHHPIWLINTIGLPQSAIDSITVFKYQKDEKLIDGTECSVCLSEFQEDENLRLLPKCSHAFHITCIDTWLRSHKNCPLCRAPVMSSDSSQPTQSEPNSTQNAVEENNGEVGSDNHNNPGPSELRNVDDHAENSKSSDSDSEEGGGEMRRSVSLDSSAAMRVYNEVANVAVVGKQHRARGSFDSTKSTRSVSSRSTKGSSSSGSGCSLQKGPISMKRSFSLRGKRTSSSSSSSSSSKHGRRQMVVSF